MIDCTPPSHLDLDRTVRPGIPSPAMIPKAFKTSRRVFWGALFSDLSGVWI
jgi:hypothetical protein